MGGKELHGFFTRALLESLSSKETDENGDGAIQMTELIDATTRRVRDASNDPQTPWVVRRELMGDFTIAELGK